MVVRRPELGGTPPSSLGWLRALLAVKLKIYVKKCLAMYKHLGGYKVDVRKCLAMLEMLVVRNVN